MIPSKYEILWALCEMWTQYCPPPYGHCYMSAGETTEEILNRFGLLSHGEINWQKLRELKEKV